MLLEGEEVVPNKIANWSAPEIEPGTFYTLRKNHTPLDQADSWITLDVGIEHTTTRQRAGRSTD